LSTERTIAAVVAEEAVAKIGLYGLDPSQTAGTAGQILYTRDRKGGDIDVNEFGYPSVPAMDKQYAWSALTRQIGADPNSQRVQVTVFVCRMAGMRTRPIPIQLDLDNADDAKNLYEGSLLVDDVAGRLYRVASLQGGVKLDRPWEGGLPKKIWGIPRPQAGGRNPCITVYQTERVVSHSGTHAMGSGNTALYAMEFTPQTGRVR
jgi:hypothetical protein